MGHLEERGADRNGVKCDGEIKRNGSVLVPFNFSRNCSINLKLISDNCEGGTGQNGVRGLLENRLACSSSLV